MILPTSPLPKQYLCRYLFLLVGTNPLPNYVSALLLAEPDAVIYLLHTGGTKGTGQVAISLERKICAVRADIVIYRREVDGINGDLIEAKIKELLEEIKKQPDFIVNSQYGLNYSSGKRPMSVHAYHALRSASLRTCFSYLDASTLKLVIQRETEPTQSIPVGQAVSIGLRDLVEMHGYRIQAPPRKEPRYAVLSGAIATVSQNKESYQQYNLWVKSLSESDAHLDALDGSALKPIRESMLALCQSQLDTAAFLAAFGVDKPYSMGSYFQGRWLEDYTLHALSEAASELNLAEFGANIAINNPPNRPYELDVSAIYGYQLFAISCSTSQRAQQNKDHLMEAYVRSRQLGGDEARTAMVCLDDTPQALEHEVQREWDAVDKIRVFGKAHLPNLKVELKKWISTDHSSY